MQQSTESQEGQKKANYSQHIAVSSLFLFLCFKTLQTKTSSSLNLVPICHSSSSGCGLSCHCRPPVPCPPGGPPPNTQLSNETPPLYRHLPLCSPLPGQTLLRAIVGCGAKHYNPHETERSGSSATANHSTPRFST